MVPPVATLTPADSARAVGAVYTVSLLAILPVVVAAGAAVALRRARAEGRVLVWRAAIVLLLSMFLARPFLSHSMAWVVPAALATPLVALGRVQMMASTLALSRGPDQLSATGNLSAVQLVFALYVVGVIAALLPTAIAMARMRRIRATARVADGRWRQHLDDARETLRQRGSVRLLVSPDVAVPMTWGIWRTVIVFPVAAERWTDDEKRIALLHELTHVRRNDWLLAIAARLTCAFYWFHPGVWYIARRLHDDCELACDDRVLASGIRASDYASLLVHAAESLSIVRQPTGTLALARRSGLRVRLAAIVDVTRSTVPIGRWWRYGAAIATLALVWPLSAVQLAPTRDVLTSLMHDANWELRAYAVVGLAQRADSVAVARKAAELDPSPRVRAWARYALAEHPSVVSLDGLIDRP